MAAALSFLSQHSLDVHSVLVQTGNVVLEGDIRKQRDESAELNLTLPSETLCRLDPGTDYWKADGGQVTLP